MRTCDGSSSGSTIVRARYLDSKRPSKSSPRRSSTALRIRVEFAPGLVCCANALPLKVIPTAPPSTRLRVRLNASCCIDCTPATDDWVVYEVYAQAHMHAAAGRASTESAADMRCPQLRQPVEMRAASARNHWRRTWRPDGQVVPTNKQRALSSALRQCVIDCRTDRRHLRSVALLGCGAWAIRIDLGGCAIPRVGHTSA